MLDAETLAIALAVRSAAERQFPRVRTLKGRCCCVSVALFIWLEHKEKRGELTQGFYHFHGLSDPRRTWPNHTWFEIAGHIIDLTRTQFKRNAEPVSVLDAPNAHYVATDRFDDLDVIFGLGHVLDLQTARMIAAAALGVRWNLADDLDQPLRRKRRSTGTTTTSNR
jgi:hypothetical protein